MIERLVYMENQTRAAGMGGGGNTNTSAGGQQREPAQREKNRAIVGSGRENGGSSSSTGGPAALGVPHALHVARGGAGRLEITEEREGGIAILATRITHGAGGSWAYDSA